MKEVWKMRKSPESSMRKPSDREKMKKMKFILTEKQRKMPMKDRKRNQSQI